MLLILCATLMVIQSSGESSILSARRNLLEVVTPVVASVETRELVAQSVAQPEVSTTVETSSHGNIKKPAPRDPSDCSRPSFWPTKAPRPNPTQEPTKAPRPNPTQEPTKNPNQKRPTKYVWPTKSPVPGPTTPPTKAPIFPPTVPPTKVPRFPPTHAPHEKPPKPPTKPAPPNPPPNPDITHHPTKSPNSPPSKSAPDHSHSHHSSK
jgi:hypothetical protein